jgi:uncharacterized protein YuzE
MDTNKSSIDIDYIIKLFIEQFPEEQLILKALKDCIGGWWESKAYYYFVNSENANKPGAEWQFDKNISIEDVKGDIVLDILKDGRIGGIEFTEFIEK